ncbi:MAG: hypothetical protein RLW62_15835, partial [Gammaproteobacteria bacterium]
MVLSVVDGRRAQDPDGNYLFNTDGAPERLLQGAIRRQERGACHEAQRRSGRSGAAECTDNRRQGPQFPHTVRGCPRA